MVQSLWTMNYYTFMSQNVAHLFYFFSSPLKMFHRERFSTVFMEERIPTTFDWCLPSLLLSWVVYVLPQLYTQSLLPEDPIHYGNTQEMLLLPFQLISPCTELMDYSNQLMLLLLDNLVSGSVSVL